MCTIKPFFFQFFAHFYLFILPYVLAAEQAIVVMFEVASYCCFFMHYFLLHRENTKYLYESFSAYTRWKFTERKLIMICVRLNLFFFNFLYIFYLFILPYVLAAEQAIVVMFEVAGYCCVFFPRASYVF